MLKTRRIITEPSPQRASGYRETSISQERGDMRQLINYLVKVYNLKELALKVRDSRTRRIIPTASVILSWIFGFIFRIPSTEELGRLLDKPRFQKLVGSRHISADVLARVISRIINPESLRGILHAIIRRAWENKCWLAGSWAGWMVIAIDGTELFSSTKRHCPACSKRCIKGQSQYYHRALLAKIVGEVPLPLDFELINSGEGEKTAALRLVLRLARTFKFKRVILIVDAGFHSPELMKLIAKVGWYWILPLKNEDLLLSRAIKAHFDAYKSPPKSFKGKAGKRHLYVTYRDAQYLPFWENLDQPVRILSFNETNIQTGETLENLEFVTNIPMEVMGAPTLWKCAHKRWDIENQGFHMLKHTWNLTHSYVHHPCAIYALIACMLIAYSLLILFVERRTRRYSDKPLRSVSLDLLSDLLYASSPFTLDSS